MNTNTVVTSEKKRLYERFYSRELTNQELFEVNQNLLGFIETLIKLNKKQKLVSISKEQGRAIKKE